MFKAHFNEPTWKQIKNNNKNFRFFYYDRGKRLNPCVASGPKLYFDMTLKRIKIVVRYLLFINETIKWAVVTILKFKKYHLNLGLCLFHRK